MTKIKRGVLQAALLVAAVGLLLEPQMNNSWASAAPQAGSQGSGFLGAWCAQGDPTKHASISSNGVFFNLTNEGSSTSIGHMQGEVLVADEWQFVQGTLSSNGNQINWSNGTFWARCNNGGGGGGGGGGRRPIIDGTWYRSGNHSQACYITQRGKNLKLTNESGSSATGAFDDKRHVTTNWNGTTIGGTIAKGGDRIDWDNGTYWTR
jgi:hypothetical protein